MIGVDYLLYFIEKFVGERDHFMVYLLVFLGKFQDLFGEGLNVELLGLFFILDNLLAVLWIGDVDILGGLLEGLELFGEFGLEEGGGLVEFTEIYFSWLYLTVKLYLWGCVEGFCSLI